MRRLFLIALWAWVTAWLGAQESEEVPLSSPAGETPVTASVRLWNAQAVDSALLMGFFALAEDLAREGLDNPSLTRSGWQELQIDLATALLGQRKAEEAAEVLAPLSSTDPRVRLRRAAVALERGRIEAAREAIVEIPPDELSIADRSYWMFLRARLAEARGNTSNSREFYEAAIETAATPAQRAQFDLALRRRQLEENEASDAMVADLRRSVEDMLGRRGGFEAARLLAIALYQQGRSSEAIEVIERHLRYRGIEEDNLREQFLLLLGLIAGEKSGRGRVALEELLRGGEAPDLQRQALTLLARVSLQGEGRESFRNLLRELIEAPGGHPLRDELLILRAHLALEDKRYDAAETSARTLLEEYPGSIYIDEATRLLAYVAWNRNPPQYRTAATLLDTLRERLSSSTERTRLGVLIGDLFFLNGDYENAAEAYGAALREPGLENAQRVLFQQVLSALRAGQLDVAKNHLDAAVLLRGDESDYRWRAEWNLIRALERAERHDEAANRIGDLLATTGRDTIPPALRLRLLWMEAVIALERGEVAQVPTLADRVLEETDALPGAALTQALRTDVKSHALLLKGRAYIAQNDIEAAQEVFEQMRAQFPRSEATVQSFLIEARWLSANDRLVEAQRNLVKLADDYPQNRHAPLALWEAALNVERRGIGSGYQEAIMLLERLISTYPKHSLVYSARLKEGDLSRKLNDFGTARSLYEGLLDRFPDHPQRPRAELALADTFLALAGQNPARREDAISLYARLATSLQMNAALRAEASFKWGYALSQDKRANRAIEVFWQFVEPYLLRETPIEADVRERYWAARAALELAELYEKQQSYDAAQRIYRLLQSSTLPGQALATARLARYKTPSE